MRVQWTERAAVGSFLKMIFLDHRVLHLEWHDSLCSGKQLLPSHDTAASLFAKLR